MKRLNAFIIFIMVVTSLILLISCASTFPPREGFAINYELENGVRIQEKENIKITLKTINELEMNKHPELFRFDPSHWEDRLSVINPAIFWFPPDSSGEHYAYVFSGMPAFLVSIENSTGHILRMSDARIYLIIEGKDPIPAISRFGNRNFIETELNMRGKAESVLLTESALKYDESLLDYIARYEIQFIRLLSSKPKYKKYPKYPFNLKTVVAINNHDSFKLINEVGREILPDFSLNGILCFPFIMEPEQDAKVIFYDITTKTDEAGNPIKKTKFEFSFRYTPKYVKYNEIIKQWEISEVPSQQLLEKEIKREKPTKKKQIPPYVP